MTEKPDSNSYKSEKRRFARLEYCSISTRPYVVAFELIQNKLPSKQDIMFSGTIKDLSVNGLRISLSNPENCEQFVGKNLLFSISFQNTNFQRWTQGTVLYVKDKHLSVTLSKALGNSVSFDDGTSCKTYNLIPIEILNKEREFLDENHVDSSWLTDTCKKNIDKIFNDTFSSAQESIFNKSIFSIINGIITTYFFHLTDKIDKEMSLETFIDTYSVKFSNNSEYALSFNLGCMRDEHIFIPNTYGDIGKLFSRELDHMGHSHLFTRKWQRFDLKVNKNIDGSKSLGKKLFEDGVENYQKHAVRLFPDPNLKLAGDAYVEQLSMYMEGRQKEISEIFEINAADFL